MPTEVVAGIALEELVVHGWDLAQAVGLPFDVDPSDLEVARSMLEQFTAGGPSDAFGARVPVDGGSPLDLTIPANGSLEVRLGARTVYLLDPAAPVRAGLSFAGDGALAAVPIWPADVATPAIVVYP